MTTVAFIQARMGSSRLPGKVLAPLAGEPSLARIIHRVERADGVDAVVVLTTESPLDEPLRRLAAEHGASCISGSELDVLDRFQKGALETGADRILRVTADCPLVDPDVLGELLRLQLHSEADYAAVATGALAATEGARRYPDGLDGEVFTAASLAAAWEESRDPFEREHVTPFIWFRPDRFRLARLEAPYDLGAERWTVDYPEDLEFVQAVYENMPARPDFNWEDVIELLAREPELRNLNAAAREAASPVKHPSDLAN